MTYLETKLRRFFDSQQWSRCLKGESREEIQQGSTAEEIHDVTGKHQRRKKRLSRPLRTLRKTRKHPKEPEHENTKYGQKFFSVERKIRYRQSGDIIFNEFSHRVRMFLLWERTLNLILSGQESLTLGASGGGNAIGSVKWALV